MSRSGILRFASRYFLRLHRGLCRICPREQKRKRLNEQASEKGREKERETEERRWAPQFISVGLISVASRGLRLTFRWSFVRRSTWGERERRRWGEGRTRDPGRGSAFFTATFWSAIPCAEEEDEVGAEVAWKRKTDGGTRTFRPIKLRCPSKVPRRRRGSLDLPLLASFFLPRRARLGNLCNNLLFYSTV